jgi:hypothetical protein
LDVIYRLLGAWLSAVFLIPKVSELGHKYKFFTFRKYLVISTTEVALLAGIICNRIYRIHQFAGFGWSQISFGNN